MEMRPRPRAFPSLAIIVFHPAGTVSWLHGRAVPLKNRNGEITGYLGSITDLTAHHQAEEARCESETRFRSIFDGATTGMVMSDLQGYLLECNRLFCACWAISESSCAA